VEGFDEDFLLEAELGGIGAVAEGAAAAVAGPGAVGGDALGGGFEDLDGAAEGELLFLFVEPDADGFVGQGVVDEDDEAVVAGEGLAAVDHFFGADDEFLGGAFFIRGILEFNVGVGGKD
jgi:hypothetical protein